MTRRFFVERALVRGTAKLIGAEAHHAAHVMRVRVGDRVTLFDGSGLEVSAGVTRVGRHEIELDVGQPRHVDRELGSALTLGVALPKGERQRWLVEKLVELGTTRLVPLITERAVAQPGQNTRDRLQRAVIEATKQCGRNRLMDVGQPQRLADYLVSAPESAVRLVAHVEGGPLRVVQAGPCDVFCAVGPEGGFTDDEVTACDRLGWQRVNLGRRILRVETAAVALSAFFSVRLEEREAAAEQS